MELGNGLRLRRLVKTGMAWALSWTGVDALVEAFGDSGRMPVVIGYHRVVEDFAAEAKRTIPAMLISRAMLERHLDWIGRRFQFVSLDEAGARLERGEGFGRPAVAVTFDDGYRDAYEQAFPLLKRKGVPATFFVATDFVGTSHLHVHDRLYLLLVEALATWRSASRDLAHLLLGLGIRLPAVERKVSVAREPFRVLRVLLSALSQAEVLRMIEALEQEETCDGLAPLTWSMLSEMQRHGMTIGSHTKTHPVLTNESREKVLDEVASSRQELERRLGVTIKHFAYPDGRFNAATVSVVAASGYRLAYTCCRHRDPHHPLLTIPRRVLWENSCLDALGRFSPAIMSCQLHGIFGGGCGRSHLGGGFQHQGLAEGQATRQSGWRIGRLADR